MNVKTTIATISILSALSFGVFAADSISDNQAANLKHYCEWYQRRTL